MEEGTALVLALQLLALASIAAALLLYLLCRLRPPSTVVGGGRGGGSKAPLSVLVTHADSALGLQIALWLAQRGFRVFAGLKEPEGEGPAAVACRAWTKAREGGQDHTLDQDQDQDQGRGWLQALRLDASKEDELHDAVAAVKGHLPADEDGLWAVVHVGCGGGGGCRGRLWEQQSAQWERLLRDNVVGALRVARALLPLLRANAGRLVLLGGGGGGGSGGGGGGVAWSAARAAVEGAAAALRAEVAPVRVITLQPQASLQPYALYAPPTWRSSTKSSRDAEVGDGHGEGAGVGAGAGVVECEVVGRATLAAIEGALLSAAPAHAYPLLPPPPQPRPRREGGPSSPYAALEGLAAAFRRAFISSSPLRHK